MGVRTNEPLITELRRIAALFDTDIDELTDDSRDAVNINDLMKVAIISGEECSMNEDLDHIVGQSVRRN